MQFHRRGNLGNRVIPAAPLVGDFNPGLHHIRGSSGRHEHLVTDLPQVADAIDDFCHQWPFVAQARAWQPFGKDCPAA